MADQPVQQPAKPVPRPPAEKPPIGPTQGPGKVRTIK